MKTQIREFIWETIVGVWALITFVMVMIVLFA
jgi:hypothetical protein